jgi:hypothetical protein
MTLVRSPWAKPMALLYGPEYYLSALADWATRLSLVALLSGCEYTPVSDRGKGGFSNRTGSERPARARSNSWRGLLVSQSEDHAILGWLALLFHWDLFLGRILGYPDCCCYAFEERWPQAIANHQGDLAVLSLDASRRGPYDWRCNIFSRYFGHQLLHHFPCSLTCMATLGIARAYLQSLYIHEPEYAQTLSQLMISPIIFSEEEGVFLFPGARIERSQDNIVLIYDPNTMLSTNNQSSLYQNLHASNCAISNDRTLTVGPNRFSARLIEFANIDVSDSSEVGTNHAIPSLEVKRRLRSFLPRSE